MNINQVIAITTLRLVLGFIFFFQGFGKVFTWGVEKVYHMDFFLPMYKDLLPEWLIHLTAYYTSYVELVAGFLVVIGLKRDYALYSLATVLVIVTFGHGLAEPIWDLSHVMPRTILLAALLLLPKEWDKYSLDFWMAKKIN
ncbi:MAG: DoxX family membrane protein [Bacteroidetes bacterium]|nr:DoxX family membrane protein [Bacteroidota bacterium]